MVNRWFLIGALLLSATSHADSKTAVADNGREVILNENGEWEYATDDIFATTTDGHRIRLMPNGEWQEVSEADSPNTQTAIETAVKKAIQAAPIATSPARDVVNLDASNTKITLDVVAIENTRETVGKNTRKRSNVVFYLDIEDSDLVPPASSMQVTDSRGRDYPVFLSQKGTGERGNQPRVIVRANGAPRWFGVKFFTLEIAPNTMGNPDTIELRKSMSDVLRKEVDSLPENNL